MGFLLQGWLPASLSNARHLQKMLDLLHIDIQGIEQVSMHISVGRYPVLKSYAQFKQNVQYYLYKVLLIKI